MAGRQEIAPKHKRAGHSGTRANDGEMKLFPPARSLGQPRGPGATDSGDNPSMMLDPSPHYCAQSEITCAYALGAVPANNVPGIEAHIAVCASCQGELKSLRPVIKRFVSWPADVLRPPAALQGRLAHWRVGRSEKLITEIECLKERRRAFSTTRDRPQPDRQSVVHDQPD